MNVPIKTNHIEVFKHLTRMLNPILKLRPREQEVLSILMAAYFFNQDKPFNSLLSLYKFRRVLRNKIGMSTASFNNHLGKLKAKNVLSKEGELHEVIKKVVQEAKKGKLSINYAITISRQPLLNKARAKV